MPIYEYRCSACQHKLESLQKLSDPPLTTCPMCGKVALNKLVSAAGFQLKGSGWYATDFKNSGSKPAAKEKPEGKSEGAADKAGEAKPASGDSAPATKTDSASATPAAPTTPASTAAPVRSPTE